MSFEGEYERVLADPVESKTPARLSGALLFDIRRLLVEIRDQLGSLDRPSVPLQPSTTKESILVLELLKRGYGARREARLDETDQSSEPRFVRFFSVSPQRLFEVFQEPNTNWMLRVYESVKSGSPYSSSYIDSHVYEGVTGLWVEAQHAVVHVGEDMAAVARHIDLWVRDLEGRSREGV